MDKRLLRITYNENRWELPSGHNWKPENQGNSDIAFENQYGFGVEEWLFNQRFNIDGFQYGYIRGLQEVKPGNVIDEAFLFTINTKTKDRFLIAKLKDVEVLDRENLPARIMNFYKKVWPEIKNELLEVKADPSIFDHDEFMPRVRFKMEDCTIFNEPILANELKADRKYNRFKPYKITAELEDLLNGKTAIGKFVFKPGIRNSKTGGYQRKTQSRTAEIIGLHNQITKDLESYLKPDYQTSKKNISIETTVFSGNIADVVLKENDGSFSILEVKTSHNARYNIREALGQLIDYALWKDDVKIKRLIIISPSVFKSEHIAYFKRIKATIKIQLEYWQYCSANPIISRFIKVKI